MRREIRVGVTEWHGAVHESAQFPPDGVSYGTVRPVKRPIMWPLRSPIKGYMRKIATEEFDLVEAVISPILTRNRWIYSLAHYAEALAFSVWGVPVPRSLRAGYIKSLLLDENCRQILFWSHAGFKTLVDYGKCDDPRLLQKCRVVYPAIREANPDFIRRRAAIGDLTLMFNGNFFIKGGVHVVDAFERVQKVIPRARLRLCCDENIDFATPNPVLREQYLNKIKKNSGIEFGRVTRKEMLESVFPSTDVYLLPTYADAFGFAVLEAMSYGRPVIATNYFAIPEMVEDGVTGILIDTSRFDCVKMFPGCAVGNIPQGFHEYLSDSVFGSIMRLIDSPMKFQEMGQSALERARAMFSFRVRNSIMRDVYEHALMD